MSKLADFSDAQLKNMLVQERRNAIRQIIKIKQRIRDDQTALAELEARMKDIEASEDYLS